MTLLRYNFLSISNFITLEHIYNHCVFSGKGRSEKLKWSFDRARMVNIDNPAVCYRLFSLNLLIIDIHISIKNSACARLRAHQRSLYGFWKCEISIFWGPLGTNGHSNTHVGMKSRKSLNSALFLGSASLGYGWIFNRILIYKLEAISQGL